VKYQLVEPDSGASVAHGIIERIGEDISLAKLVIGERELRRDNPIADHDAALRATFELFAKWSRSRDRMKTFRVLVKCAVPEGLGT
jgi:acetate kinase